MSSTQRRSGGCGGGHGPTRQVGQQRGLGQFLGSGRQDVDGWLGTCTRCRRRSLLFAYSVSPVSVRKVGAFPAVHELQTKSRVGLVRVVLEVDIVQ